MDVKQYLQQVTPYSVTQLLPNKALRSFLDGYSFALRLGITVLYPKGLPLSPDSIDYTNAWGPKIYEAYHPLCATWRHDPGCAKEGCCLTADREEAWRYFGGTLRSPRIYRCKPLGLWDMSYPLTCDGAVIGVLLAGQAIVESDAPVVWRTALGEHAQIVDWETCHPEQDVQTETIAHLIDNLALSATVRNKLLDNLRPPQTHERHNLSIEEFVRRIDEFLGFGKMLQNLLDELYKARTATAEQQLMRWYDDKFAKLSVEEPHSWWQEFGRLMSELVELPEIASAALYVRRGSRYELKAQASRSGGQTPVDSMLTPARDAQTSTSGKGPSTDDGQLRLAIAPPRLHTRDIIMAVPSGELRPVTGSMIPILPTPAGNDSCTTWAFRLDTGRGQDVISSLTLFTGTIKPAREDFVKDLWSVFATAANQATRIFRDRDTAADFLKEVKRIGHSFRTPLQVVWLQLESLQREQVITHSDDLRSELALCVMQIGEAKEDLHQLLTKTRHETEEVEYIGLLKRVLMLLEPMARGHPCMMTIATTGVQQAIVRAVRYDLQRALLCLVDNAIKYSYIGTHCDGSPFEVRVSTELVQGDRYVEALISNFGVGFPMDRLAEFQAVGGRGNVRDPRAVRSGSGLGLAYAYEVFEELGGYIHIESAPSPYATPREKANLLGFKTDVRAALPLAGRR
jgi:signal transduction histidine kinase